MCAQKKKGETIPKRPNFLFMMNDQFRYPTVYDQENKELRQWQRRNLRTQDLLRKNGLEFTKHYIGSNACTPSRATLFTAQYPSLHGVSQTSGAAKSAFDADMYWLDENTVPTMGDYFRRAGYNTYYKGKWHFSNSEIIIPGTHDAFTTYNEVTGVPIKRNEELYLRANRLNKFGFSGWVGPEPHGTDPRNSASSAAIGTSGRDVVYAKEVVKLIQELDQQKQENPQCDQEPWLIVSSFVDPHDIALYGLYAELSPLYNFEVDPSVPDIPPAPTADEDLATKPVAQRSYRHVYPRAFQPITDQPFFRRLYYSLQKKADQRMMEVYQALKNSSFFEDTIVIFTADHGELLGAHGGLFQKWYQAYEEAIHVPLIISNPLLYPEAESTDILTSHVDIIPTMLGIAHADVKAIKENLRQSHTEVRRFVGRDLYELVLEGEDPTPKNAPLYFMTDDNVTSGPNQVTATGKPYKSVRQPNQVETVITFLPTGEDRVQELWKYSRYFNASDDADPCNSNQSITTEDNIGVAKTHDTEVSNVKQQNTTKKKQSTMQQYEMYNLTVDPLEQKNLANRTFATPQTREIQKVLNKILAEQRLLKRLYPRRTESDFEQ